MHLAFSCECGKKFSRRDNLFQHMRAKGCEVWYWNGHKQTRDGSVPTPKAPQSAIDEQVDPLVERMMADAEIAKQKNEAYFRQMRGVALA